MRCEFESSGTFIFRAFTHTTRYVTGFSLEHLVKKLHICGQKLAHGNKAENQLTTNLYV